MTMATQDGRLVVVSGASRSGKTAYVARQVRTENRVLAYDPEDQWSQQPGFRRVEGRRELSQALRTAGHMKIAFVPGTDLKADFDFCCAGAMTAGRYVAPLHFIGEELADVTTPSKAPGHWGILVRRGLKRGINLWAISQRWAEADKTAFGNASEYVLFASRGDDIAYISRKTRVPEEEIAALKPLEFIRFDPVTKDKTRDKLRFRR